ncbi:photosynthetic complex assembly protein PuhC [Citromicrobium bathyomarinum]|uniref:photosynthetic complex assembly protein PuhC n=1 Tax=Citromicrobium bathyomarinum TaxID=72174 RepID=UPI00315A79CB
MSLHHDHTEPSPKAPLIALAAVAGLSLALASSVSFGLVGRDAVPELSRTAAGTQMASSRSLHFRDASDGGVEVFDASTGAQITTVAPGTGGFIRSTMRGLAHVRQREGLDAETPFELILWDDGGLTLTDPATGETRELGAFGRDNRAAFAALLDGEAA